MRQLDFAWRRTNGSQQADLSRWRIDVLPHLDVPPYHDHERNLVELLGANAKKAHPEAPQVFVCAGYSHAVGHRSEPAAGSFSYRTKSSWPPESVSQYFRFALNDAPTKSTPSVLVELGCPSHWLASGETSFEQFYQHLKASGKHAQNHEGGAHYVDLSGAIHFLSKTADRDSVRSMFEAGED